MREKLSTLMGQYLLKGYRMLGRDCQSCAVRHVSPRLTHAARLHHYRATVPTSK